MREVNVTFIVPGCIGAQAPPQGKLGEKLRKLQQLRGNHALKEIIHEHSSDMNKKLFC